ncbi:MAG: hypothetical protein L0G89_11520, partial [Janibacter sp.]|nr:hypothetical protein [Janibacter sp.]
MAQSKAVIALPFNAGFLARPILTDPQIQQHLLCVTPRRVRSRPLQHVRCHLDTSTSQVRHSHQVEKSTMLSAIAGRYDTGAPI